MAYNIVFNGFNLNEFLIIKKITRGILPEREVRVIEIPNKDGGQLQHVRHKPKVVPCEVQVIGDLNEQREKISMLASILNTKEEKTIVFSDEPTRTYYGMMSGASDLDQIAFSGEGTITFVCPDPHGYEEEIEQLVTGPTTIIDNQGNADLFPVIEATFKAPSTFFSVADPNNNVVLVGNPDEVTAVKKKPEERILRDQMDNISLWQAGEFTQIDGTPTGTMKSNGWAFIPDSWGTATSGWYGPTMKRSLSEPLQDFRVEVDLNLGSDISKIGRVEVYLLGVNNEVVGKLGIKDLSRVYKKAQADIVVGDYGANPYFTIANFVSPHWQDFRGFLKLERRGNRWWAYVGEYDQDGRHHTRYNNRMTINSIQTQVSQVLVHFGRYSNNTPITPYLHHIDVYKLNTVLEEEIPEIILTNDVLEVDHMNGIIRKNGEKWMNYLDAGSKFFGIPNGQSEIAFFPNDPAVVDLKVKHKTRWLG